ncbi:putative trans-sialidase, partial [Trypanosoma cruzi]
LFVVMMCCGTGAATADVGAAEAKGFSPEKPFHWRDVKKDGGTVSSLRAPVLVEVNGGVFAVVEAQCKKGEKRFTGIASKLLTLTDETLKEDLDATQLKTQLLVECSSDDVKPGCRVAVQESGSPNEQIVDVGRPTTVVEGNDIYMLVGKHSHENLAECKATSEKFKSGMLLVKGEVSGEGGNKQIHWNDTHGVPCTLGDHQNSLKRLIGGGGSGLKMKDDTILFPVEGTKKEGDAEEDGKTVSLIIYSSSTSESWKLSNEVPADGCSDPSVVEWEKDKKLMMMTAFGDGRRRVYESGDKGESWTEALGTLSRVWGNKHGEKAKGVRSGFITAKIDGVDDKRNVMLVTLPVYSKEADTGGAQKGKLHLWLTDNTHIVDIGPVSGEGDEEDVAASSLLYRSGKDGKNKQELIALYEKKGDEKETSTGMVSVLLTAQLERVKEVLTTWNEVDKRVSQLCPSESDVETISPGNACSPTVKITDGLVGFLSGNLSDGTWKDEYLGVNATVKGNDGGNKATLHASGVKFQGAWAEWPVGKQGENQLYHFANYNFTLVATVSIHGEPRGDTSIPLMGAKMNDSGKTVLLGL